MKVKDFIEFIKLPPNILAAVSVVAGTILFIPDKLAKKMYMYMYELRNDYGFIVSIVFLISFSILIVLLTTLIYKKIDKEIKYIEYQKSDLEKRQKEQKQYENLSFTLNDLLIIQDIQEIEFYTNPDVLNNWSNKSKEDKQKIIGKYIDNITIEKKNNKFEISNIEFRKNYLEDMIYNHYKFNTPCNVYMYEDEYGIPLKLNHELKTMKEAENYFKRLEKYVGDYKLNYYISEIDEKENRFNYTQNNDVEKIIRLIGIGDKRKKDDFKLGVITLDLSMFKDKDGKEIYKKLFDKLEKERLT